MTISISSSTPSTHSIVGKIVDDSTRQERFFEYQSSVLELAVDQGGYSNATLDEVKSVGEAVEKKIAEQPSLAPLNNPPKEPFTIKVGEKEHNVKMLR